MKIVKTVTLLLTVKCHYNECRDEPTTSISSNPDDTSVAIDIIVGEILQNVHTVKKITKSWRKDFSCNKTKFDEMFHLLGISKCMQEVFSRTCIVLN